jgi:hypothetical protein
MFYAVIDWSFLGFTSLLKLYFHLYSFIGFYFQREKIHKVLYKNVNFYYKCNIFLTKLLKSDIIRVEYKEVEILKISDKIVKMSVEEILPYHNNPKKHPAEQVDKIASSIRHYGFVQPIVIDGNNEIILGHGRFQAAKKLKMEEVPVVVKDDLTESEVKALRIADNKVAESDWDMDMLELEFEQIEDEFSGFDPDEIEDIMADFNDEVKDKEDLSDKIHEEFQVIVKCETEAEQEQLFYQLTEEGYNCQVLTL